MLANFDLINLVRDVNYDDSFYYFQIAYNLAQGKFSTFDGGITQTNGYHPVWLLLITPLYWILDKETALFGIKAFEIMLVAGGVALIALAAWLSRLAWLLLFAALPTLYRDPEELLLGMEAAAAMFTLALLILAVCLYMRDPQRWKWHLAAIAFALPWARIEYIAISLAVTAALCVIEWSRQERRALRLSELANIRHIYTPLIGAAAGILVYFAYNRLVFGGALPVSAAIKLAWSQERWAQEGGYDIAQSFWYTLQHKRVFDYEILIALEICAYLLIVWWIALRSKERRDWLLLAFLIGVFGLAAGHLAKFAQTVLATYSKPGFPEPGFQIWYFVPAYLMMTLIIPVRVYIAIRLIRRFIAPRWRATANALCVGVVVIGAAVLLGIADFAQPFKYVNSMRARVKIDWEIGHYMGAQVLNHALPEGSVVGVWDAGIVGYFSRFPVVNLDGLVNSYDFFYAGHAKFNAMNTQSIESFRRYGITHFANLRRIDATPLDNVMFEDATFTDTLGKDRFMIWTYDPAPEAPREIDYSQQVWDNMKPRFDYLQDGIGVVFAGRAAQAFAKDCRPDEPLIWTWRDQKRERSVIKPNLYRSRANMCVASRILPHGAGQPAQARTLKAYLANLTASRDPIIRSDFDVYLIDPSLIYVKTQCGQEDIEAQFFANIFPVELDDLPDYLRQRGYETIDFGFTDYGAVTAYGNCWASIDLPGYPISEIHTGQYAALKDGYIHIWEDTYKVGVGDRRIVNPDFGMLASAEPIIRSDFDLYISDGSLIYTKSQCGEADVEGRFFANVYPVDTDDLPDYLRRRGYETIDFNFNDYGVVAADGKCWAALNLPSYPVAEIHAGQYVSVEDGYAYPWEGVYRFD